MKGWRASLLLMCWLVPAAGAESVVDQEFLAGYGAGSILDDPGDYIAQTFTSRHSGQIVSVGVEVSQSGHGDDTPISDDLFVRLIRTDSLGVPDINDILATSTISRFDVPVSSPTNGFLEVDLRDWDVPVKAGDVLAIALSSDHTYDSHPDSFPYVWHERFLNPHPDGEFYIYSPTIYGSAPYLVTVNNLDPSEHTLDLGFRVITNVPEPAAVF